jgi:hypothetical protein
MENEMETEERQVVERELSRIMEVTLNLENELNAILSIRNN